MARKMPITMAGFISTHADTHGMKISTGIRELISKQWSIGKDRKGHPDTHAWRENVHTVKELTCKQSTPFGCLCQTRGMQHPSDQLPCRIIQEVGAAWQVHSHTQTQNRGTHGATSNLSMHMHACRHRWSMHTAKIYGHKLHPLY